MVVLAVTWMAKAGRETEVSALFSKLTEESRNPVLVGISFCNPKSSICNLFHPQLPEQERVNVGQVFDLLGNRFACSMPGLGINA